MEIEYQASKKEFNEFYKCYYKNYVQKRGLIIFILLFCLVLFFAGKPFELQRFLIGALASIIVVAGIYYYIPLLVSSVRLKKTFENDKSGLAKKKIVITDKGLLIESESRTTTWRWESIVSVHSIDKFIYFVLADKKIFFVPKRCFQSYNDEINFLGLIQSKFAIADSNLTFLSSSIKKKPSYLLGLICLVPMFGAIAGIVFIVNGISRYKDKWFVIIGIGGILFTACFWYVGFYTNAFGLRDFDIQFSQRQLNTLMKDVEFYKMKNGSYPDSLKQLNNDNSDIFTADPLQPAGNDGNTKEYNYHKAGNHYYLFSSGVDGIPNTKDDIYPQVSASDSSKFGLIRK